jgi:hypothetical protein
VELDLGSSNIAEPLELTDQIECVLHLRMHVLIDADPKGGNEVVNLGTGEGDLLPWPIRHAHILRRASASYPPSCALNHQR